MVVATTDQVHEEEVVEQHFEADKMRDVKSWAMQSPDWKMLNVLIENLDSTQLQYKCENGKSIFANISLLLRLALTNSRDMTDSKDKGMTKVKSYIIGYLFPLTVTKSLTFLTPELTVMYLEVMSQAQAIEGHFKDFQINKQSHNLMVQKLHQNLIDCKGVSFSAEFVEQYDLHFENLLGTFNRMK